MPCFQIQPQDHRPDSPASLGGSPLLPADQPWPACEHCQTPMTFFLQFPVQAEWKTKLKPGSQLSLFMCLKHSDPLMPPLQPKLKGELPQRFWELKASDREYSQFLLQLTPPEQALVAQSARPGLVPRSLRFEPHAEALQPGGRTKLGEALFKIGGTPSWFQDPEKYTCCCGAAMDFLFQIPKDMEFPKQSEAPVQENTFSDDHYLFFLGNEVYVFACRAQCHPQALWPISQ
ncbi:MAG: hypothetical protein ACAI44_11845 [Candidatus Sericytochromatia bacterium]